MLSFLVICQSSAITGGGQLVKESTTQRIITHTADRISPPWYFLMSTFLRLLGITCVEPDRPILYSPNPLNGASLSTSRQQVAASGSIHPHPTPPCPALHLLLTRAQPSAQLTNKAGWPLVLEGSTTSRLYCAPQGEVCIVEGLRPPTGRGLRCPAKSAAALAAADAKPNRGSSGVNTHREIRLPAVGLVPDFESNPLQMSAGGRGES